MVNVVEAQKTLLQWMMKMAGVSPLLVEVEPGTVMSLWVPSETLEPPKLKPKPTGVLVHGFAADGIFTWQFQVGALTKKYRVYVVDLLFFGGSTTNKPDRTPEFQAVCVHKALRKVGVDKCAVVGFSYGGMVSFKLAEMYARHGRNASRLRLRPRHDGVYMSSSDHPYGLLFLVGASLAGERQR